MLKNSRNTLLLLGCLALFAAGVVRLLQLRISVGDVYPPYSTLRTDPLGAKAFYKGLGAMPDFDVARRMDATAGVDRLEPCALFVLGADIDGMIMGMPRKIVDEAGEFMRNGGRLVFAFEPVNTVTRDRFREDRRKEGTNSPPRRSIDLKEEDHLKGMKPVDLRKEWGFRYDFAPLPMNEDREYEGVKVDRVAEIAAPASIFWHTSLHFTELADDWRTIYERDGRPVIVERSFGEGSLVLCADSQPFSNEAMLLRREAGLLAWFVGPHRRAVFDEVHHGVAQTAGIATLVRRYRLHGVALTLLVLAGLYIWRNANPLVPPNEEVCDRVGDGVVGRDAASGFVNLLRRGVLRSDLLETCCAEWRKSRGSGAAQADARARKFEEAAAAVKARPELASNPANAYREISRILKEHKT